MSWVTTSAGMKKRLRNADLNELMTAMEQPPPMRSDFLNQQDESHLKVISICHYVLGGFCLLGLLFLIGHFVMVMFFFKMAEQQKSAVAEMRPPALEEFAEVEGSMARMEIEVAPAAPVSPVSSTASTGFPSEIMPLLIGFYVVFGIIFVAMCVCNVLSGLYIRKRKNRIFSYIVAGINCCQFPLGTALGVFTFIVLSRPSVKLAYDQNQQV